MIHEKKNTNRVFVYFYYLSQMSEAKGQSL